MKTFIIVMTAWTVVILVLMAAPWMLIILGSLWGMSIEIGEWGVSSPGLLKGIKKFKQDNKRIKDLKRELKEERNEPNS